jgi:serine/threonine-protein kinase
MQENPYAAPESTLGDPVSPAIEIPPKVSSKIKNAYLAGIASGSLTLLFVVISQFSGPIANINGWGIIDVLLIFGLAYGIYRKSRTCAVILFVYFVSAKIYMVVSSPAIGSGGLVLGVVFAYYYFQGILGTFEYRKLYSNPSKD